MVRLVIHTSVYNINMKQNKRIRKNIMVNPDLVKRAKKVFGASSDSQAIEEALNTSLEGRKTDDELWEATIEFVKHLKRDKIKPLFS